MTANNRKERSTPHIDPKSVFDIWAAVEHAERINLPLNMFVTVNYQCGGIGINDHPQTILGQWLKRVSKWLAYRKVQCSFVWVMEHSSTSSVHTHLLIHCPSQYVDKLKEMAPRWLKQAGLPKGDTVKEAILIKPVGVGNSRHYFSSENATAFAKETFHRGQTGVLKYILKGRDPAIPNLLGIQAEPSIPIYGRRVSRSQNLTAKARNKWLDQNQRSRSLIAEQWAAPHNYQPSVGRL